MTTPLAVQRWRDFCLGGNAIFTLVSKVTQKRFTFKVRQADGDDPRPYFIHLLSGPDNTHDYQFLGTLMPDGSYRHGRSSCISATAASALAARWFVVRTVAGLPCTGVDVFHEGRCCRCGRLLTVPESIESGVGPECAKKQS